MPLPAECQRQISDDIVDTTRKADANGAIHRVQRAGEAFDTHGQFAPAYLACVILERDVIWAGLRMALERVKDLFHQDASTAILVARARGDKTTD